MVTEEEKFFDFLWWEASRLENLVFSACCGVIYDLTEAALSTQILRSNTQHTARQLNEPINVVFEDRCVRVCKHSYETIHTYSL